MTRTPLAEPCPEPHEYGPADPHAWMAWAVGRRLTHELHECPDCRLLAIWRPHAPTAAELEQTGLFYPDPRTELPTP